MAISGALDLPYQSLQRQDAHPAHEEPDAREGVGERQERRNVGVQDLTQPVASTPGFLDEVILHGTPVSKEIAVGGRALPLGALGLDAEEAVSSVD